MRWNSKDQEKRLKLQALTIQCATSKLGREVEGPDEVALAGGPRCTKHWQFGEIPSGFSGRLVMVVTVTRLEPGHCTAVSYDSHAWWGSCERPMSDVTSLVRCAQPQAPWPSPVMPVSCPLESLSKHIPNPPCYTGHGGRGMVRRGLVRPYPRMLSWAFLAGFDL